MATPRAPARRFFHTSQAWYGPAVQAVRPGEEIMLGFDENGPGGEFAVRWHDLDGAPSARLEVFHDAWQLLPHFEDLLQAMAQAGPKNLTPGAFCKLCADLGIVDQTPRVRPPDRSVGTPGRGWGQRAAGKHA